MKDDNVKKIEGLITKNIPFVIFREPGKEAMVIFQSKPLGSEVVSQIDKRGFYVFPFSKQETSEPIFYDPEYEMLLDDLDKANIDLKALPLPKKKSQNLYEVDEEEYINDLNKMLEAFDHHDIKKAIYSRISEVDLDLDFDSEAFFRSISEKYPKAFTYLMNIPGDGLWVGASPELLLSYESGRARTVALAGTLKIEDELSAPEWTRKEIDEHRLVEKYIISLCEKMQIEFEKSSVRTSNTGKVYHLKSDFTLYVEQEKVKEFLQQLHPTPAISGLPQDSSTSLIYKVEKHERSYYCGFLGFVENLERFDLYINLRCMKVVDGQGYLFAGGGITPDSNPEKEWEETKIKMATLTDILQKDVYDEEISSVSC